MMLAVGDGSRAVAEQGRRCRRIPGIHEDVGLAADVTATRYAGSVAQILTCPQCASQGVPVVDGLPTEQLKERSRRGEVLLGGRRCWGDQRDPAWGCRKCGSRLGRYCRLNARPFLDDHPGDGRGRPRSRCGAGGPKSSGATQRPNRGSRAWANPTVGERSHKPAQRATRSHTAPHGWRLRCHPGSAVQTSYMTARVGTDDESVFESATARESALPPTRPACSWRKPGRQRDRATETGTDR